ncbi:hypothetical protein JHK82_032029 [Glycine max]|nr:hypothetical protein JHK85_032696 [Glycine max]KAG5125292.1 hypothetical protein JHK82_032029 [Glycine max]KAG5146719.1 hypothetical protein JHK84_032262 [Glycine max]
MPSLPKCRDNDHSLYSSNWSSYGVMSSKGFKFDQSEKLSNFDCWMKSKTTARTTLPLPLHNSSLICTATLATLPPFEIEHPCFSFLGFVAGFVVVESMLLEMDLG